MNKLHVIALFGFAFIVNQYFGNADPISDKTARYECLNLTNESMPILTVDLNSVDIQLANSNASFNLQNLTIFDNSVGRCREFNETFQKFTLQLDTPITNTLTMYFSNDEHGYRLERIIYRQIENNVTWEYALSKPDLRLRDYTFKPKLQGYKCKDLSLSLPATNPANSKESAEIQLGDFMFLAFQDGVATNEVTRLECRPEPRGSLVPIVVGAALLVFAIVIGVLYYLKRDKPTPAAAVADKS